MPQARRAQRRAGCRAGGDAVIDDDGGAAGDFRARTIAEVTAAPPLDLGALGIAYRGERGLVDAGPSRILVTHDDRRRAVDHGAHRQLRLNGTDLRTD